MRQHGAKAYAFAVSVTVAVILLTAVLDGGAARAASGLAAFVQELAGAGPAPPPYTDPSQTTTNALGGVGRTQGWTITPGASAIDLLDAAEIPSDVLADVEAGVTFTRFVTIERVPTSSANTVSAVCVRLGPDTNTPGIGCPELQDSDASTGGCFLDVDHKLCKFTIRPIKSCVDYASCHQALWSIASTSDHLSQLHVQVAW